MACHHLEEATPRSTYRKDNVLLANSSSRARTQQKSQYHLKLLKGPEYLPRLTMVHVQVTSGSCGVGDDTSEAIMDEPQHQVLPFHPSAIWNDWSGLLRQTKPHSCWPRQDSFPFQWRELLPASTQNSQWCQQQRPPHSTRTPGCHGCCPENYLFIPALPYPYITCPNPSFAWITMIPPLSHRPLQPS